MSKRNITANSEEQSEGWVEPGLSDMTNDDFDSLDFAKTLTEKVSPASKRRRAEQGLEILTLREELGDYSLDFGLDL